MVKQNKPIAYIKYSEMDKSYKLFNNSSQPIDPRSEPIIADMIKDLNSLDRGVRNNSSCGCCSRACQRCSDFCSICCALIGFILLWIFFLIIFLLMIVLFPIAICICLCCPIKGPMQKDQNKEFRKRMDDYKIRLEPYYIVQPQSSRIF